MFEKRFSSRKGFSSDGEEKEEQVEISLSDRKRNFFINNAKRLQYMIMGMCAFAVLICLVRTRWRSCYRF